jgi:hypothetical protein
MPIMQSGHEKCEELKCRVTLWTIEKPQRCSFTGLIWLQCTTECVGRGCRSEVYDYFNSLYSATQGYSGGCSHTKEWIGAHNDKYRCNCISKSQNTSKFYS